MKQFYLKHKTNFSIVWATCIFVLGANLQCSAIPGGKKHNQNDIPPDYGKVFPQNKVNRIELVITPEDWNKMMGELKEKFGEPGSGPMGKGRHPFPGGGDSLAGPGNHSFPMMPLPGADSTFKSFPGGENDTIPRDEMGNFPGSPEGRPGQMLPFGEKMDSLHRGSRPPQGFGGPMPMQNDFEPQYVSCSLLFEGQKWEKVGFRLKGNSSLMGSWGHNIKKFPFRLEFDKYSDSISRLTANGFFGFRKLSFSNNTNDQSFMREKITNEIFRDAGIKAPQAAFYQVYINFGDSTVYCGLYTAIEIIEDSMLKNQFGDESGNCYKPEGQSAAFTGTFDTKSFEKKTNKKAGDWSDVEKLFNVLNSDLRKTDPAQWRTQLESIFDVPAFINWLAVNTTIQNWDTYGQMAHNYYLYNNPATKKLTWIPWDNNEALSGNRGNSGSLSQSKVNSNWPLIRYLMDQPEYAAMYKSDIKSLITNIFIPERMKQKYEAYQKLISPYVIGEKGEKKGYTYLSSPNDFNKAVEQLQKQVDARNLLARKFIEQ